MSQSTSPSTSKSLLLGRSFFFFVTICGCFAQDTSSYYFPSQNRFVPSSGSFPRQQPQSLSGFRASSGGFAPSPGSYQEQLLFIANENAKQSPAASTSQFGAPFGGSSQFAKPNRQTDFYDISPRPFGVPAGAGPAAAGAGSGGTSASLTNGFTRSKAIRNGSGNSLSGGFQPQTQRINVPHQQTQFLAHFSENGNEKRPVTSSRPFGNGGFSPTRTRTQAPVSALPENPATPAGTPFRPRNRYQPGSSTASTTTTTTGSAEVSSKRYNRFGGNRAKPTSTTTTSTTLNTPSERPSFGRKSPNPRRPVFISREVNEPVSVVSKRPFDYSGARLKLPARPTARTTSTTESAEEEEEEEALDEEQEDEEQENSDEQYEQESDEGTEEHSESSSLEKLPLQEESVTPVTVAKNEASSPAETSEPTTISETGHESSTSSTEESQTDVSEVTNAEVEVTTEPPVHEEEIAEEATTIIPQENQSTEDLQVEEQAVTTEPPLENTSKQEEVEIEKAQENLSKQEDTTSSKPEEHSSSNSEIKSVSKQEEQSESQYDDEGEGEDYEYEDEEGSEDSTSEVESQDSKPSTPSSEHEDDREIISVVTTKSVVNGSTVLPVPVTPSSNTIAEEEEVASQADLKVETTTPITLEEEKGTNATENYVVVASIQPSRSINGARFLPFPAIEQEETKQTLSELERKVHSKQQQTPAQKQSEGSEEVPPASSSIQPPVAASTESIIDKLDRVQSELSSGLLSGKYPIISQMDSSTPATSTTVGTGPGKFVPHIRKYQPRTTSAPRTTSSGSKLKVQHFDDGEMDELATLLPVGFKPRPSYKNRKITTTTSTTEALPAEASKPKPGRNSTISRSFKSGQVTVQDVAQAGLLPKGYKPPRTTSTTTTTEKPDESSPNPSSGLESLFSVIQFDEKLASLLPKDYKLSSTAKPKENTTTPSPSTTPRNLPVAVPFDDLSTFQLPPGYKAPELKAEPKLPPGVTPIKIDSLKDLLPPGFKLNETESDNSDEIPASLLPPGYKSKKLHPASTTSTTTTTTTSKPKAVASSTTEAAMTESAGGSGLKVVFPKGFHKRLGSHRLTTPHPSAEGAPTESSNSNLQVMIKKGPPTRATTEFTGWPTPPTTPLSIDKLNAQTINFEDLLTASGTSSTTSTTTTSTSTTTTTTPRPTKPGHCTADCDLAATIKIIDGVAWKPELLDHNTLEWKNLAHELEAQLNDVYSGAPQLNKWYKKVRIDSFSKGSVLVDYYVELANITEDVDTLEIRQLFHDALTKPATPVLPDKDAQENETDSVSGPQEEQLVTASYQMGKYIIDPVATDFSVIAKNVHTNVEFAEEDLLIPQWAIVVIVIGVGSLVFVVIFGVTVLLNRQKRAKKTPIPLTNDMLNELKVNHMGGADNYGVDDFYNIDDPWNDTKQPIKPKRFTNSMHGSNSSNIYDSWRSTRHPHTSGDYFYDQQPTYSQKGDSLKRPQLHHGNHSSHSHSHHHQAPQQHQQAYGHQYPDAFADAHQMYSYNNHASRTRYARDYDPDF
ncbi:mucin-5AC [Drosophila rhopaloa]|uniref:Mucin-5AC n=1 Tax=Drosophila rhopaloa TaxID=1041015 RepID=A0A6P4ETR8_DRORH|nr:mucin-5AC [Drosophila rhopaloa]XP_016976526.1 mucin-5AC [Drosophila rhopaloa]XP_016976527.1 mucin-5AC [Drosophila rhopaloa]XP_016976529.1 mucin-5AC [Drosophila rhopaloa]XP_016976530.1 mucin-5AC [Drosophila rhopaloa]XP_016976531.1 mucin-5AC [Drosophila rhopaloa]